MLILGLGTGIFLLYLLAIIIPTRHKIEWTFSLPVMLWILIPTFALALVVDVLNRGRELILNYVSISVPRGYLKRGRLVIFYKDILQVKWLESEDLKLLLIRHKHGRFELGANQLPDEETFQQIYEHLLEVIDPEPEDPMAEVRFSYRKSPFLYAIHLPIAALFAAVLLNGGGFTLLDPIVWLIALYPIAVIGASCWIFVRNLRPREIVFGPSSFSLPESYLFDRVTTVRYKDMVEIKQTYKYRSRSHFIQVAHRVGTVEIDTSMLETSLDSLEVLDRLRAGLHGAPT